MLHPGLVIANFQIHIVQQPGHAVCILRADAHQGHMIRHRAIDRAGIHIAETQRRRQLTRQRALPGPGRAVNGDCVSFFHSRYSCRTARPAA